MEQDKRASKHEKPTSLRLSPEAQQSLEVLIEYLQDAVPSGVKVNQTEAIEYAIIEAAKRVKGGNYD